MKTIRTIITAACLFCTFAATFAQTIITMEKENGVYKVPCTVNGLRMKFIFDTGAATVCISESMASFMLENGYLKESDIIGTGKSSVADGRIVDHVNIILHRIEIGGKLITDVSAVVISGQSSPLLLGQSALAKIGRVSISGNNLVIEDGQSNQLEDINQLEDKAILAWNRDDFQKAAAYWEEYYYSMKRLYPQKSLDRICENIGDCYWEIDSWDRVIEWYSKFSDKYSNTDVADIALDYMRLGLCYYNLNERKENTAIKYFDKAINVYKNRSNVDCVQIGWAYYNKSLSYVRLRDYEKAYTDSYYAVEYYFFGKHANIYERYKHSGEQYIYTFLAKQNILDANFGKIIYQNAMVYTLYQNGIHCEAISVAAKMGSYDAQRDYNEYCRQYGW